MSIESTDKFGVLVETKDYEGTLYLHSQSFGRLMDDVVVPYEKGEAFFVDGVSIEKKNLRRIKIVRQSKYFEGQFMELHHFASSPSSKGFVRSEDYPTRLAVLFRGEGEDVTGQIINAFRLGILPRLKEYLPKRDELISAALTLFVEGTKALASKGGALTNPTLQTDGAWRGRERPFVWGLSAARNEVANVHSDVSGDHSEERG